MPKPLHYRGFKIHANFSLLTVWTFDSRTKQLISTGTHKPHVDGKKLSKDQKQAIIFEKLDEYGLPRPPKLIKIQPV
jgi:hypothetical protein